MTSVIFNLPEGLSYDNLVGEGALAADIDAGGCTGGVDTDALEIEQLDRCG